MGLGFVWHIFHARRPVNDDDSLVIMCEGHDGAIHTLFIIAHVKKWCAERTMSYHGHLTDLQVVGCASIVEWETMTLCV
jgi:hypothetical protein